MSPYVIAPVAAALLARIIGLDTIAQPFRDWVHARWPHAGFVVIDKFPRRRGIFRRSIDPMWRPVSVPLSTPGGTVVIDPMWPRLPEWMRARALSGPTMIMVADDTLHDPSFIAKLIGCPAWCLSVWTATAAWPALGDASGWREWIGGWAWTAFIAGVLVACVTLLRGAVERWGA